MKKALAAIVLLFLATSAQARQTVVYNRPVTATAANPSSGLTQAFILDDGNADLTDWAGTNNLTLKGVGEPAWAGSNNGLVFDGTDDYASFTPTTTDWQGGYTVAVLSTLPNTVNQVLFHADNSGDTDRRVRFSSNEFSAFNRAQGYFGRQFSNNEGYVTACETGNSAKLWRFLEYDGTGVAAIYENATTTCGTDSSISEFGTIGLDRARLGSTPAGANFLNGTIYRVLVWNRALTSAEKQSILDGWTPTHD